MGEPGIDCMNLAPGIDCIKIIKQNFINLEKLKTNLFIYLFTGKHVALASSAANFVFFNLGLFHHGLKFVL